jgi:SAM-dependent methyltransferase
MSEDPTVPIMLIKISDHPELAAPHYPQEDHPERGYALRYLGDFQNKVVADIGCGRHKTHEAMIGVDPEPGLTDFVGTAENLPFDCMSIDGIVMRHSLEHVLDQAKAVNEWRRVCRSGSTIVIILPDHGIIDTMDTYLSAGQHVHAYSMESFKNFLDLFVEIGYFSYIQLPEVVIPNWSFGTVLVVS